ncbi:MAG: sugar phosphate isomerase/epimerase family protein [Chthonomonadales bacterium]
MNSKMNRRDFMATSVTASVAAASALTVSASAETVMPPADGPKKALIFDMLPNKLSIEDRMKLAHDCGFDGVESGPISDQAQCERMRAAAEKAGIRVHSVIYGGWDPPLTDPDPAKREKSLENAQNAMQSAKWMGADDILLVPGTVNAKTSYANAYKWSHEGIKKLIPTAEKLKILICVEEVWNNFLLSPLEYTAYIDSFKSPWVQSYFDVGNVVAFAWPEDWVRTVGKRIHKVHLKDYKGGPGLFGSRNGNFVNLREGSINWPEVRKAFAEIGYTGFMTTELGGGDEAYLRDVAKRVDKIFAGE